MIVCKYSVAWGTTADCAKTREPPAPASRRALTCAQANRGMFSLNLVFTFLQLLEKKRVVRVTSHTQHKDRIAKYLKSVVDCHIAFILALET
jgi:hypothetical protein